MGFYNSSTGKIGWSKNDLVHAANSYAIDVLGCSGLPGVLAKTVGMMGLREQRPLLNVVSQLDGGGGGGGGDGGGLGGGGDGSGRRAAGSACAKIATVAAAAATAASGPT